LSGQYEVAQKKDSIIPVLKTLMKMNFGKLISTFGEKIKKAYTWLDGLFSLDHQKVGNLYLNFGTYFGMIAAFSSIYFRSDLFQHESKMLLEDPAFSNLLLVAHPWVMILFMIFPVLVGGYGNILIPPMVGAPRMAFPTMNNISFWLLFLSFSFLTAGLLLEAITVFGWIYDFPFNIRGIYRDLSADLVIVSLHLLGASYFLCGVSYMATIFIMKAEDMTMLRLDVFAVFFVSLLFILLPLVLEEVISIHLTSSNFDIKLCELLGGDDLRYRKYLFWLFFHSEVYLLPLAAVILLDQLRDHPTVM
jgi:cytochrome c oxidase subunit I